MKCVENSEENVHVDIHLGHEGLKQNNHLVITTTFLFPHELKVH